MVLISLRENSLCVLGPTPGINSTASGIRNSFSEAGHGGVNSELARLVGSRGHHTATIASANDNGFAAHTRVEHLFHRSEEGVHIDVEIPTHGHSRASFYYHSERK